LLACGGGDPPGAVHVSTLDNDIGPVTANFVDRALDRAEDSDATVWILQLDTPGGLITASDDIVQRIESANVPVVVFVGPLGARAASAGTFITMSAHIAAMAPSTQIGAAHPVAGGGDDIDGDIGDKITNDAAADIRAIAQLRGRNAEWAELAVRESVSITADEAVAINVVDLVATDIPDLLTQIDGREIELRPGGPTATIRTQGAALVETNMTLFENILDFIADPNIAFLLISLGGLALLIEIITPGLIGPGVFGVIALIFAFFALGALDTNPTGIALIVLAFALLVAEVFVAGFGFLGIGAIIALFIGGLLLVSDTPGAPQVSIWLLVSVVAFVAAVLVALWILILTDRRKRKPHRPTGDRAIGHSGYTRSALDPEGSVIVNSEMWSARTTGADIPPDTRIRVLDIDGLCLLVEPVTETAPEPA
jgi:membrane-bound serine protease (ClpP class)